MDEQPNDRWPTENSNPLKKLDWWLIVLLIFIGIITFPILWRFYRIILPFGALAFILYFAIRYTQLGKIAGSASNSAYPTILMVWNEIVATIKKYIRPTIYFFILSLAVSVLATLWYNDFTKSDDTKKQLEKMAIALIKYKSDTGRYPTSLIEFIGNDPLKKEWLKDTWGNNIIYTNNTNNFSLRSSGKDGKINTNDDILVE